MKKLIGISLIALFAVTANSTLDAQVYPGYGYSTIVKTKSDGKRKVKVVPNPPVVTYYTPPPRTIEVYHTAPYYGYRKVKYYDDYRRPGRRVIMYDDRYPHRTYYYYR